MLISNNILPIAIAVGLSILSGTGVFLMELREGKVKGTVLDFLTTISYAVTAGLMAYYVGRHQKFDEPIIYFSVLLSSNNGYEVVHMARKINTESVARIITQIFTKGGK
ncbi:holin [Pseudocitrobacter sp. RIT415]|uniref:holin n=1 Tax=Pseudocitrobacter sp. RIT415 TaxID=2202163 RepID=UPI000D3A3D77|nr:holin [Pseudocitrobacter sp. RIT 415]RAU45268.1 holin [Pseudocitrobacter sp. RIT 415]